MLRCLHWRNATSSLWRCYYLFYINFKKLIRLNLFPLHLYIPCHITIQMFFIFMIFVEIQTFIFFGILLKLFISKETLSWILHSIKDLFVYHVKLTWHEVICWVLCLSLHDASKKKLQFCIAKIPSRCWWTFVNETIYFK